VNRETILKFFDGWMSALDENCHNQSVSDLKIIKRDFANLPPVTPKQRTGKWIDVDVMGMPAQACDQCNTFYPLAYTGGGHHFCPNCGAKMEVTT
jgi:hypothetical protein